MLSSSLMFVHFNKCFAQVFKIVRDLNGCNSFPTGSDS